MQKKNILVTGCNGQLGSEIRLLANNAIPGFNFLFENHISLDVINTPLLARYFDEHPIDYCINCAAYTSVDKAESEPDKAFLINSTAPGKLARICESKGTFFIHFSTDFVFDGNHSIPYKENDTPNPISIYGKTKENGEQEVIKAGGNFLIIRTSWVYSSFGLNFIKTILRLAREKKEIGVVYDQTGCLTYASDLGKAVVKIVQSIDKNPELSKNRTGIYHYSNEGITSWYDVAHEVVKKSGLKCKVNPIETHQYPTPAKRPAYSVLNKSKIKDTFGIQIPHWEESLDVCLKILV
ncbi:MAG: dTDP-4-dehydrorhamnose reductase [Bacteroidetes bacterium RIFCSPLOWO2_02_FULL_36_8]|nr:MAG: dTDP-4-dehydrorhamnose reductase [Bacteroidetes bacterium RIFCSPLOWO2_02_FULL_36_8]OFY71932.1 MAG: dTDP-4-dehydrorhamnose reductase [Bacteroidetes bacterium RIFCSPLOWO2_12_FULL_37_12]